MKRLQFRHHDEVFNSRELALAFIKDITDPTKTLNGKFGDSLFAEPLVVKYLDNDNQVQVILNIGADSGNTPYHIIDTKELYELLSNETKRATKKENDIINGVKEKVNEFISEFARLDAEIEKGGNLQIVSKEGTEANVLKEYILQNNIGKPLGESIKIYKDSSLVTIKLGHEGAIGYDEEKQELIYGEIQNNNKEYLYLVYRNENGEIKITGINFEDFILEAEFGNGIKVVDNEASIKIKEDEKFLNVDENGLYTMNITESINESFNKLNDNLNTELQLSKADYIKKIEDASKELAKNKIISNDVTLKETEKGVILSLKVDNETIVKNEAGRLSSPLKIKSLDNNRFVLINKDGNALGDTIEIPAESSLHDVRLGQKGASVDPSTGSYTEGTSGIKTLDFTYRLDDGTYRLTQIEISDYFIDITYGNGLYYNDNILSIKKDEKSENYLEIYENSIAITGVTNAISATVISAVSTAKNDLVANIDKLNSNLTYNIDSLQQAIDNEQKDRLAAIAKEQKDRLAAIDTEQKDRLAAIAKEQQDRLAAINNVQSELQNTIETKGNEVLAKAENTAKETAEKIIQTALDEESITKLLEALENFKQYPELEQILTDALLKKDIISGDTSLIEVKDGKYFIPNDASKLFVYDDKNDSKTKLLSIINNQISDITALNEKIEKLEKRIEEMENNESVNEDSVKQIINSHIRGKEKEIKVQSGDTEMIISFADDAIFG